MFDLFNIYFTILNFAFAIFNLLCILSSQIKKSFNQSIKGQYFVFLCFNHLHFLSALSVFKLETKCYPFNNFFVNIVGTFVVLFEFIFCVFCIFRFAALKKF